MGRITLSHLSLWKRCCTALTPFHKADGIACQSMTNREEDVLHEDLDPTGTKSGSIEVLENNNNSNIQIPKRKFAIMLAYCGRGYHGMQMDITRPNFPTIESTLISALIQAQCIPEIFFMQMKQLKFQRCARTDKGVSALGQLVSVRLLPSSNTVEKINSHLPPEIAVIDMKRVTKGFCPKKMCDKRSYSYMLPTYALSGCAPSTPDSSFRLPREDFHNINNLLSFYKGTHNFHNFTSRKVFQDPSSFRHMLDLSCSEPFVLHGIEFAQIHVTGQSFMLYQIRKMVGLIIAVAQGIVPADFLPQCMQMETVNIPPAPGLGLLLERVHFDWYNKRYGGDGFHQPISWEKTLPFVSVFWKERILPEILEGELENLSMAFWIEKLKLHNFIVFKDI
ncbi:tRNA pseudouridine synthase A isoform X2 [Xenopus laevis]|nr:tRNA pseudouridine synthase A isoform X2 [Xenopus laevis]XP_041442742.1 tRNA pseudouridine synthase A isoform X2 [Xenopus laevis]OCT89667.1 hypothetical protein XELAEV_18018285mg [Xenopus laevis]